RRATTVAFALLLSAAALWLWAHEGHAPLPTRGASVDPATGVIVLSPSARTALDVQTAEAKLQTLEERIIAPATVVAPWQLYAYPTSRIEGKIVAIHARPGQAVSEGDVLAEVESLELEDLQLELLNAQNDLRLSAANQGELEAAAQRGAVADNQLLEVRT